MTEKWQQNREVQIESRDSNMRYVMERNFERGVYRALAVLTNGASYITWSYESHLSPYQAHNITWQMRSSCHFISPIGGEP